MRGLQWLRGRDQTVFLCCSGTHGFVPTAFVSLLLFLRFFLCACGWVCGAFCLCFCFCFLCFLCFSFFNFLIFSFEPVILNFCCVVAAAIHLRLLECEQGGLDRRDVTWAKHHDVPQQLLKVGQHSVEQ